MRALITGGAGFVGTNLASALAQDGHEVIVFDNLARRGVTANLEWLRRRHPDLTFVNSDVRDEDALSSVVRGAARVYHLAAQVAVTTSVTDPATDFEVNLRGSFNVLEAVRRHAPESVLFYTSTNKVYGGMEEVEVALQGDRYAYCDLVSGVSEAQPLDFHSPYGCSKGGADQYVRDYARIYGLRTVVFRMSCIYGPHQCGNEDQGWVAHFVRSALAGETITVFGDGRQVRDVLYVDDLVRAFEKAARVAEEHPGSVFNIGGGPANTLSLRELVAELGAITGRPLDVSFADWRPGDQRIYISDIRKADAELGWEPSISRSEGLRRLVEWMSSQPQAADAAP